MYVYACIRRLGCKCVRAVVDLAAREVAVTQNLSLVCICVLSMYMVMHVHVH